MLWFDPLVPLQRAVDFAALGFLVAAGLVALWAAGCYAQLRRVRPSPTRFFGLRLVVWDGTGLALSLAAAAASLAAAAVVWGRL